MSWLTATGLFLGFCVALGGPTEGDAAESVYGTWAVAHGRLACVYPAIPKHALNDLANPYALAAPLYSWFTGGLAALFRFGSTVPFPSNRRLGPGCENGFIAMYHWSARSGVILPTVRLGYVTWVFLLAGVVTLVRASGRGRRGWEVLAVMALPFLTTVWMNLTYYFHPQDIMAMGLALLGVAALMRDRPGFAGVALGLAFCTQQFTLLILIPLFFVAFPRQRVWFVLSVLVSSAIVDGPLVLATSGRGLKTVVLGSSRVGQNFRSTGGTVLWEANLHGWLLFLVSRVAPLLAAMVVAAWIMHRAPVTGRRPASVMSLVVVGLLCRLIFEENLFGYYFMAASIGLVLVDVVAGRVRTSTLAWLALVTLAFNPLHVSFVNNLTSRTVWLHSAFPIIALFPLVAWVGLDVLLRRRIKVSVVVVFIVALITCESRLLGRAAPLVALPNWAWQLILVPFALTLVGISLRDSLTNSNRAIEVGQFRGPRSR